MHGKKLGTISVVGRNQNAVILVAKTILKYMMCSCCGFVFLFTMNVWKIFFFVFIIILLLLFFFFLLVLIIYLFIFFFNFKYLCCFGFF